MALTDYAINWLLSCTFAQPFTLCSTFLNYAILCNELITHPTTSMLNSQVSGKSCLTSTVDLVVTMFTFASAEIGTACALCDDPKTTALPFEITELGSFVVMK